MEFKRYVKCSFEVNKNEKDNIGIFTGIASLFDVPIEKYNNDLIFKRGSFKKAITSFTSQNRQIPMFWEHNSSETIGAYSASDMRETDQGLMVTGNIDLDVRRGYEAYSLISKNMISGLSVGGSVKEEDVSIQDGIEEVINFNLYEISITPIPAVDNARINTVNSAANSMTFSMLPSNTEWNEQKALRDIKRHTKSQGYPSRAYRHCFAWYDKTKPHLFSSYRHPFVYSYGNELKIVPKALQIIKNSVNVINNPRLDLKNIKATPRYSEGLDKILNLTNKYI